MTPDYKIYVVKNNEENMLLGSMSEKHVTYNRYSEGLLIAAGKLVNTSVENKVFLKFITQFHDTIPLRFEGQRTIFEGNFTFSNFDPDSNIVVFGSVRPVFEHEKHEKTAKKSALKHIQPRQEKIASFKPAQAVL